MKTTPLCTLCLFLTFGALSGCSNKPDIVTIDGSALPAVGASAYCFDANDENVLVLSDQHAFESYSAQWKKFGTAGPTKQQLQEIERQFTSNGGCFRVPKNTKIRLVGYYAGRTVSLTPLEPVDGEKNCAYVAQVEVLDGASAGKTGFVAAESIQTSQK